MVGLDEAGRGPLAGPVVAAAVMINGKIKNQKLKFKVKSLRIKDSKQLSERKREELYLTLTGDKQIQWGVGVVSEKVIDKINILEATKLAMGKALNNLSCISCNCKKCKRGKFLLIDGNFTINPKIVGERVSHNFGQKAVVRGDQKVFSIAVASIIAKVTRDRIMRQMHKKYPEYGFDRHKGYGTKIHIANLKNFGSCDIHRKTFFPVKDIGIIP